MYSYTCTSKIMIKSLYMYTKVTLGEHETKSLHLCQITLWHTTKDYTSKKSIEDKIFIDCGRGVSGPKLNLRTKRVPRGVCLY